MIDNLSYNYNGATSLLSSVSDASNNLRGFKGAASSYGYDPTGNMTSDSQKGITDIAYTYNDLPIKITSANGTIENFYTSAGEKLKSIITPTNQEINAGPVTRIYLGSAEYVDGELEAVYTDEGRVVISKDGNYPEYYLKDHLGNTRVRIADKNLDNLVFIDPNDPENDELMSTHHYYPFGMEWDTPALDVSGNDLGETGVDSRYTYNGKEFVDDLDIGLHDYEARYYDPAIARWTSIDPLAEKFDSWSPYNYVIGNPMILSDPNGMDTLNMHRGALNTDLSDEFTNVWNVTFSLTKNGVTSPLELPDGTSEIFMMGNKEADEKGDNVLNEDSYTLTFQDMSRSEAAGWENTINVTEFGVFIHPGNTSYAFSGCKGLCKEYETNGPHAYNNDRFFGKATQSTINQVRALYDKHENNLTGSKFLLRTNSSAPRNEAKMTRQQAIKLLNQAGGINN